MPIEERRRVAKTDNKITSSSLKYHRKMRGKYFHRKFAAIIQYRNFIYHYQLHSIIKMLFLVENVIHFKYGKFKQRL